MRGQDLSKLLT